MTFDELVELARVDEAIVGLVLTGSRGRGFAVTDDSDWDVRLVVRDEARDEYRQRLATRHGAEVEVVVLSLSEFQSAGLDAATAWDRYSYVGASVVIDAPSGSLARLVMQKAALAADEARRIAAERLDDYVNAYYRSTKNLRAGLDIEARLDAAESVPPLLDFLFAVNGRVRPFNRFLRWDLEREPLAEGEWSSLVVRMDAIASGDLSEQQRMFRDAEVLARAHGHADVIDGWEPDLALLRGS